MMWTPRWHCVRDISSVWQLCVNMWTLWGDTLSLCERSCLGVATVCNYVDTARWHCAFVWEILPRCGDCVLTMWTQCGDTVNLCQISIHTVASICPCISSVWKRPSLYGHYVYLCGYCMLPTSHCVKVRFTLWWLCGTMWTHCEYHSHGVKEAAHTVYTLSTVWKLCDNQLWFT